MSTTFWDGFFQDAGIPASVAKSYAATFEENRISKEMLLDLDKEILADMGIKVMGDVISILKHARKEARKERVPGPASKLPKPSAVHSTQSAQAPAVSTTSSPLSIKGDEENMQEGEMVGYQEEEPEVPAEHDLQPAAEQYGTLHSDQLLLQQVVAAVAQQQQQQQQGQQQELDPILLGLEHEDEFEEEYVTAAYKRQQQKRALGTLYSDDLYAEPHLKQPRLIVLPQGEGQEVVDEDLGTTRSSLTSGGSSRRLLEAAGLVKRELLLPNEKSTVTSSGSVFSRLDRQSDTSPTLRLFSYPSTSSSPPSKRITVKASPSPQKLSPQKLSMTVTSRERRVSDGPSGGSRGGRSMAKKEARSLVSSSSGAGKDPLKSRLGVRSRDRGAGTTSWSGTTNWSEMVSTSTGGSGGRVSDRLGTRHESGTISSKRPKPTMMADSASSPPPRITSRLGASKSKTPTATTTSNSGSSKLRKSKNSSSMVADEYELVRQLDIRSRLAKKEEEVKERRRGPLTGRLGQHQVFKRLT